MPLAGAVTLIPFGIRVLALFLLNFLVFSPIFTLSNSIG
jgi:hypothetical protein